LFDVALCKQVKQPSFHVPEFVTRLSAGPIISVGLLRFLFP
jgi:hypothetical protein